MTRVDARKATLVGLLAVLLTAFSVGGVSYAAPDYDGDGFTTDDCAPLDPAVHPGVPDKPDLGFEDNNCDGVDGDLTKAVFVTKTGNDAQAGTREGPLKTIGAGITMAKAATPDKDVYVAGGTYSAGDIGENLTLQSGVGIYGSYKPGTGARGTDEQTIITAPQQGLLANNVQGVVLQLLTLRSTADDNDGDAYGLRAIGGASVLVQGVTTQPGDGKPGSNGGSTSGTPGSVGTKGTDGVNSGDNCGFPGGLAGGSGGGGGNTGGTGGAGGGYGIAGSDGLVGAGTGAGTKGLGGAANAPTSRTQYNDGGSNFYDEVIYYGTAGTAGGDGANGASTGASGANGSAALTPGGGTVTFAYPAGAAGSNGGAGPNAGASGGGGGGGGGANNTFWIQNGRQSGTAQTNGGGGGGGGGGGHPGPGGTGGGAGGGSFGIYVHNATVVIDDSSAPLGSIGAGKGGNGGNGGAGGAGGLGQTGGPGGVGGYCFHYDDDPHPGFTDWYVSVASGGAGGQGGKGGNGSPGGPAGAGVGGPSASVFATGATAAFTLRSGVPTTQAGGGTGGQLGVTGATAPSGPAAATLVAGTISSAPTDFDGDGKTDGADACPGISTAGGPDANADGCPDRAAKLADGDGDSIPDSADACPAQAAGSNDANGDGCPDAGPAGVISLLTTDADGDGAIATIDCDDQNAARKPGNLEIPGNSIDENCDLVVAPYSVIASDVTAFYKFARGRTRFTEVTVKPIPAGGRVLMTCKNPKGRKVCPFKKVSKTYPAGAASLKLLSRFKKRRFPGGAVITVQVTAPLTIGKHVTFKTLKNKLPTRKQLCLMPGATKATTCA